MADPLSSSTADEDEECDLFPGEGDSAGNGDNSKTRSMIGSASEPEGEIISPQENGFNSTEPFSFTPQPIDEQARFDDPDKCPASNFETKTFQVDLDDSNGDNQSAEEGLKAPNSESCKIAAASGDSPDIESADLLALIEDEVNSGPKDLDVVVENPEKIVKTMESYVAFTVKTKTTQSEFEDAEYRVKRRYNDFLWLRVQLEEQYPHLVIPPLPEKHSLTIDRFDKEFIKFREVALDRFIRKLAQHPITSKDPLFKAFITLETNEFQAFKKKGTGLLSRMTKSISNMGGSFMLKQRSEEYTKMYEYCTGLGERMGALERITARLTAEQNDYLTSCGSSIALYQNWQSAERRQLAKNMGYVSELMDVYHASYKSMVDENMLKLMLPFKEYSMCSDIVKSALGKRDALQHELEVLAEEVIKANDELQQLESGQAGGGFLGRNSAEDAVQLKKDKVNAKIVELDEAHAKCKRSLEERNKQLNMEIERWNISKRLDMKETVSGMAERNIAVYDQQIGALEDTLLKLKKSVS